MTDTLALMGAGFVHAIAPVNLLAMLLSTIVGITIGCLPGLSAAMGVALLLPVTFGMDPATGLIVLGGIYCGAIFGGSISAILIHTPGTPASAATAIEGYQLTLRGKAAKALFTACFASFCGGLLSCISLYFFSPLLAQLAMKFKSPEYFWLSLFGLTIADRPVLHVASADSGGKAHCAAPQSLGYDGPFRPDAGGVQAHYADHHSFLAYREYCGHSARRGRFHCLLHGL